MTKLRGVHPVDQIDDAILQATNIKPKNHMYDKGSAISQRGTLDIAASAD